MKRLITVLLAVGLSASGALCAETIVASKVDSVELHIDGAQVTRIAHCNLMPGETSIILRGLPPRLSDQSLRISGLEANGITIRSVSTRRGAISPKLVPKADALINEQQDLEARLDALKTKQRMIQNLANAQPTVAIGDAPGATTSPEFWSSLWTKVADGQEDTGRHIRETQRRLDVVVAALQAKQAIERAAAVAAETVEVVLEVSADHATEADLTIVYQVGTANWQPVYDARLRTDRQTAQLDLTRRARISQSSGEDWTDVALTLATSRLSAATAAATLSETSDMTENSDRVLGTPPTARARSLFVPDTPEDPSGAEPYDATLQVPDRVSVANDASKLFGIGSSTVDVDVSVRSVPIVDKHAYLQARFETKDRVPLLPGVVKLYRDGAFVGQSMLEGAVPGDRVTIGFGIDDLVSIERTDMMRKERNTTIESGIASVERAFDTVVTNRHPFPIKIEIDDREPAFNNVAIVLKELPTMTPPTDRQIDGHRGVLAWTYSYAPGETRNMTLAWQVHWPAKLGPIQGSAGPQIFRFQGGATF